MINSEVRDMNCRHMKEDNVSGTHKDVGLLVGHQKQAGIQMVKGKDEANQFKAALWRLEGNGQTSKAGREGLSMKIMESKVGN